MRGLRPSTDWVAVIPALANALCLVYYLNPFGTHAVEGWGRAFGPAALAGISIGARTKLFQCIAMAYPLVFLLIWVLSSQWTRRAAQASRLIANLDIVFLPTIVASYLSRFLDASGASLSNSWTVCGCVVANLAIVAIDSFSADEKPSDRDYLLLVVCMYLWALTLKLVFQNVGALARLMPLCIPLAGLGVTLAYVLCFRAGSSRGLRRRILGAVATSCVMPAAVVLASEALYVLNAHGMLVRDHRLVTFVASAVATLLLIAIKWVRTIDDTRGGTPYSFWLPIVCLALVVAATQYEYEVDYHQYSTLFELGNRTVVMDTITTGSLPVVDYFSAHALRDVLTPLLSQLVTNDPLWAIADLYGELTTAVSIIVFYAFLKELFEEHWAACVAVLFPFMVTGLYWSSLCFLGVLGALRLLKNPNWPNYLLFWVLTAFGAFYQYDFGISIGVACIVVLFLVSLGKRTNVTPTRLVGAGVAVGLALLAIAFARCLIAHIPPVDRLREWLSVTLGSSEIWATESFGDATVAGVTVAYSFVPAASLIMAAYVLFNRNATKDMPRLFLVLTLALAYYLFIPRILVYHNYAVCKGKTGVLLNYFPLLVLAFSLALQKRTADDRSARTLGAPLGSWFLAILLCSATVTGIYPQASSSVANAANEAATKVVPPADASTIHGKGRITLSAETQELCDSFEHFFSLLLEDDETFFDFSNITGLYALTGRERPTYVGELPGLLTNQYSQECCIRELAQKNPPIAVVSANDGALTASAEGIPHNARYYLLAEYLYDNYRPLVMNGDFALWCLKDRYTAYQAVLNADSDAYELIDYGYDRMTREDGAYVAGLADAHDYSLGEVPYLWANEDTSHAVEGAVSCEAQQRSDGLFSLGLTEKTSGKPSYLLIECDCPEPSSMTAIVSAADNEASCTRYAFSLHEGSHTYLIRVSSDYNWWAYGADTIALEVPSGASVTRVAVLEGD